METIDGRTMKEKWEAFKATVKMKADQAWKFAEENPKFVLMAASMILPATASLAKSATRSASNREEQLHRERDIYDPRRGHTYRCKRAPKSYEWEEIDQRHKEGEDYSSILRSMRLI